MVDLQEVAEQFLNDAIPADEILLSGYLFAEDEISEGHLEVRERNVNLEGKCANVQDTRYPIEAWLSAIAFTSEVETSHDEVQELADLIRLEYTRRQI